tara:strand:+ start:217 stop:480 length:264 start_codon:yes stop_codon:yes gene_type:complete
MDCGLGVIEQVDILYEIKNSNQSNYDKIKQYKKYLLDDKSYRFPDIFLEFIARERLDLKFTKDEIIDMRQKFDLKTEQIKTENETPI